MRTSGKTSSAESNGLRSALRFAVVLGGVVALLVSTSAAATGSPPQMQAETPQISSGAYIDGLIQSNPGAFRAAAGPAPPGPDAPPLGATWDAIDFDGNETLTGFYQIPPDPSGAVGPTRVVNVTNSVIQWFLKTGGAPEFSDDLRAFFSTAPTPPATTTFDPKVIYDQYAGRFVVTTMERREAAVAGTNQSRVYIAVSDDSDPNGTWFFHTIDTEEAPGGFASWADFPGFSVDSEAIYYTYNLFRHDNQTAPGTFNGQRLRIIAKAPFYSGGAAVVTVFNPSALTGGVATTMQPTQMYGDTPGGVGTYLMTYSGLTDGTNVFLQIIRVDSPLGAITFTGSFLAWGTVAANDAIGSALASAPQLGTARTIATNDRRVSQNAVFRSGRIYLAAPIRPPSGPDATQTTAHWFIVDPVASTIIDQGNIGGEDIAANTHTFFPSVAVDSALGLAVGFGASAPSIYPGSYYTTRIAGAPAGTTEPAGTLRAGLDYYIRDFTTSMVVASRWGDYSGIWLDPSDERTFCVFNEHAIARGTILGGLPEEDGRWRTAWGCFILTGPTAVTMRSFTASSSRSGVVVRWRTGSELAVLGYNVWGELNGKRVKLNRSLIASGRSAGGSTYRFTYRQGPGKPFVARFWLQRVNGDGSRAWHGPAQARSH